MPHFSPLLHLLCGHRCVKEPVKQQHAMLAIAAHYRHGVRPRRIRPPFDGILSILQPRLRDATIVHPPVGGWSSINQETLAALKRNDAAIALPQYPYLDYPLKSSSLVHTPASIYRKRSARVISKASLRLIPTKTPRLHLRALLSLSARVEAVSRLSWILTMAISTGMARAGSTGKTRQSWIVL